MGWLPFECVVPVVGCKVRASDWTASASQHSSSKNVSTAHAPILVRDVTGHSCTVLHWHDPVLSQWRCLSMVLRPHCVEHTAHAVLCRAVGSSSQSERGSSRCLSLRGQNTSVAHACSDAQRLCQRSRGPSCSSSCARVVAQSTSNGSAVHKLERAKHIPVLCHQMLYQCLPFLFALFKCHCGSPHVFINETRKLCRNGWGVMIARTNTRKHRTAAIEINTSAHNALETAYEHKTIRTHAGRIDPTGIVQNTPEFCRSWLGAVRDTSVCCVITRLNQVLRH